MATVSPGCETLCQFAYASVPGWCAYNQYAVPDWYYDGGCYVGPVFSADYCGAYAVPVYRAFYDRGSRYNFWNSRAYVRNNIGRIGHHGSRSSPVVTGTRHPQRAAGQKGAATTSHKPLSMSGHRNPSPVANHAPNGLARHGTPKPRDPGAVARNRAAAHAFGGAKKASRSQPRAVAHAHPKPAARPNVHAKAHATPHPQHAARAQPHVHHVTQARSGHGRHK